MAKEEITVEKVREALSQVKYPGFSRDIVSFGLLKGVALEQEPYGVLLEVTTTDESLIGQIVQGASESLARLGAKFEIRVTQKNNVQAQAATALSQGIDGVKHIVAVASGKGGVGKSTVAANLAAGLRKMNLKVGLLDCDIYGPSMGLMFGTAERPYANEDQTIEPVVQLGIRLMSMGFLLDADAPAILRGPIVTRYTQQLLKQTRWGELDVLVLDLPPGTGDIQLTIVQTVALSGAVIVTTPQDIALLDAKKGVAMFKKTNVPILGIVENMSYYQCPKCGNREEIFSHGGGKKEAVKLGVSFLGEVPLDLAIREGGDKGIPVVFGQPESTHANCFMQIAQNVWNSLANK